MDADVLGVYLKPEDASAFVDVSVATARQEGLRVEGDPDPDDDWDVSFSIRSRKLD